MLTNHILWRAIIFIYVASSFACAADNCTFSEKVISEKRYSENNAIAVFQWFPKSNEAKGVLSNGNIFSVKHWSCIHYGTQAIMLIGPQMKTIPEELNDYVTQLGKLALSEAELQLLTNLLKNQSLKLSDSPIKLSIRSKEFDEFYVHIDIIGEAIFIEIKLYKA